MTWEMGEKVESFKSLSDVYLPSIEREMQDVLEAHDPGGSDLFGLLRYHLGWVDATFHPCSAQSGKRLRPVLCLLACEGCDGEWEQALPAAAAVELLHNFSLIHDDIEDEDERRRGRPTVWSLWGLARGINAGDTLFSISQLAMLRLLDRGVPSETVVQSARLFNETCVALTAGQHLDIGFEDCSDVSVDKYVAMIEAKTAALVACSCKLGAMVAGASSSIWRRLHAFGHHTGLAFQMQDDVLGIWGDPTVTGKPVGADIARRKKTLPILHALGRSAKLRALLARPDLSEEEVQEATRLLEAAGSRRYAEQLARKHYDLALDALGEVALRQPAANRLSHIAKMLLNRER